MKKISLLATVLALSPVPGSAQTADELLNDGKNTDNVLIHSMGYDRKSYSPLKQINKSNIKRLVPVWSTSLMNDSGELSAPADLQRRHVRHQRQVDLCARRRDRQADLAHPGGDRAGHDAGRDRSALSPEARPTLYNGKLFRVTIDNHLLALDMKTGKEMWKQKFADWREGYYATGAPIIANGVLISGMAGGESTTRGFLDGWDPETGKKLWRRYTIPGAGRARVRDLAGRTATPGRAAAGRPGAPARMIRSSTWSIGAPATPSRTIRGRAAAMDSLYTSSVLAIRPKTGEIVCHFQYTPNDVYDVDGTDEHVLADLQIGGQPRKVMIQANKNGFLFVLDRTNCKLIAAHPYVKVNWATHYDLATGRPVLTDIYKRFAAGEEVEVWPSARHQRGADRVQSEHRPDLHEHVEPAAHPEARAAEAAGPRRRVRPASSAGQPEIKPGDVVGHFVAMNPLTGEKKWEVPLTDLPSSAGMLVTGGGLVFTGRLTGEFIALDEETGKTLWQFKTGSSINSTAITYTHKGHAICEHRVGARRQRRAALGGRQGADRRLDVDVRVDARIAARA